MPSQQAVDADKLESSAQSEFVCICTVQSSAEAHVHVAIECTIRAGYLRNRASEISVGQSSFVTIMLPNRHR
jgi:hypothetical protein